MTIRVEHAGQDDILSVWRRLLVLFEELDLVARMGRARNVLGYRH
jgi:hypothetical protein